MHYLSALFVTIQLPRNWMHAFSLAEQSSSILPLFPSMNKLNAPLLQEPEEKKASIASCSLLLANGAIGTVLPLE